jgi:N-acetylneuraminic acid mutarotase
MRSSASISNLQLPYLSFPLKVNFPIGGFVNNTEVYDPTTNTWTMLNSTMSKKKGAFGFGAVGKKIVAAGGFWDGLRPHPDPQPTMGGVIKDVQVFDTTTASWTKGTDLKKTRDSAASAVANGQLWLCGGENDEGDELDTLEPVQL